MTVKVFNVVHQKCCCNNPKTQTNWANNSYVLCGRYVTDMLKMCMKKLLAKKRIFYKFKAF